MSRSKCWNDFFLFSVIFLSFFFPPLCLPALNVWAYNWGKANIVLKQTYISPCLSKCSVSHTGICFLSLNWTLIVFQSSVALIMICMKNISAVEMMIRIPVVMTAEIESWPCEELMYCSRANMWQEWGFAALGRASHTAPLILCNNWLKKTKYCGKGHLGGACRSKVCLHHPWPWFLYKLALSLSMKDRVRRRKGTWTGEKERKQCCFGLCLDPHLSPRPCLCQVTPVLT